VRPVLAPALMTLLRAALHVPRLRLITSSSSDAGGRCAHDTENYLEKYTGIIFSVYPSELFCRNIRGSIKPRHSTYGPHFIYYTHTRHRGCGANTCRVGFLARQQALQVYKRPWPRYTCTAYIPTLANATA
jgi:hypothetical protein